MARCCVAVWGHLCDLGVAILQWEMAVEELGERKVDRETAGYSSGGAERCGVCRNFLLSSGSVCTKVAGPVAPVMWCRLFERNEAVS